MPRKIKTNIEPVVENDKIDRAEKFFAVSEKKKVPVRRKAAAKKAVSEEIFSEPLTQEEIIQEQIIPEAEVQELIQGVENEAKQQRKISKKMVAIILLGIVFFGAVGSAGYFYYQYKKLSSSEISKDEISSYVSKIGKFMVLPEGEVPTMATVADKEKLSSQLFFAKAENGDKVLFFSKAQKAILYRPNLNKVIEATSMSSGSVPDTSASAPVTAPVAVEQSQAVEPQQQIEQPVESVEVETPAIGQASVTVNNGTTQKGLAKTMAEKISQISGVTVASTGNAVGDFEKTIVVDLGGKNEAMASEIAKTLDGEVAATLPSGETKPEADILVIVGGK